MPESESPIFKDYVQKYTLGAGGYGTVYMVENYKGVPFALKVLHKDVELKRNEAETVIGLSDPRLVKVIDYGETTGNEPCILMEYVPDNLESALDWGNISEDKAVELFREILLGLEALENHSLIHRDIKPENLFLHSNIVKIGDFGSAKITSGESVEMSRTAAMTLHYCAPERFEEDEGYGFEVDRWSAAVVFCRMLSGAVPFAAKSKTVPPIMKAICMHEPEISMVPERFKSFFEKAFQKDASKRHSCVEDMRKHFEKCAKLQFDFSEDMEFKFSAEDEFIFSSGGLEGKDVYDSKLGRTLRIWTEPITGMEFVWVEGGTFVMGSPEDEEGRQSNEFLREVETDGFWIGRFQATQKEWVKIMGRNPSYFQGERWPVEMVSWSDCSNFIARLNARGEGGFSLPAEQEWEYACRAGSSTPFNFGNSINADLLNYDGNYVYGPSGRSKFRKTTTEVGSFQPNYFGLYDMHGNVWEWCKDVYEGEKGPEGRVMRGGGWRNAPAYVRSAVRGRRGQASQRNDMGFRLVKVFT